MASNTKKEVKEGSGASKVINIIVNILLIIAIIIAFLCTYTAYVTKKGSGVPSILGYIPLSIQSNSMSPFFDEGDLIIDKEVSDASTLEVGDVITFWTIIEGERVLNTHRITDIEETETYRYFYTKGDNNSLEDSLTVHESEVVGKYCTKIKGLGKVLDFLQTGKGFFIIIVLPVLAFFIYYLVSFIRTLMEYQREKNAIQFEEEFARREKERKEAEEAKASEAKKGADGDESGNVTLSREELQALLKKAGIVQETGSAAAKTEKADSAAKPETADTAEAKPETAESAEAKPDTAEPAEAKTETAGTESDHA